MTLPTIAPAGRVRGKTLAFRNAGVADAAFILALRTDALKSLHLSRVSPQLQDQVSWLERYRLAAGEAYFIIERVDGEPLGTVRLYDARGDSFCWGSWVLKRGAPSQCAIESALMVYAYAVDTLGFGAAHFQVRRENTRVRSFHERFGAVQVSSGPDELEYSLTLTAIRASMQRFDRYLPDGVRVEALA